MDLNNKRRMFTACLRSLPLFLTHEKTQGVEQKAVRKYYQKVINAWYVNLIGCER